MTCSRDTDGDGHCGRRYCPECGGPDGEGRRLPPDDRRCAHTMRDGEGELYRCIDKAGHAGAHSCAPADAHPAPAMERDAYAASLVDEQAVKAALNVQAMRGRAEGLANEARARLVSAGIEGRTVRVQVWIGDADCGVVIVPLGGSS